MEYSVCNRCGAPIRNTFLFQGNIYGSECILKIPLEDAPVRDGINLAAVLQGLLYLKVKTADLDEIINLIPPIGTTLDLQENRHQIVTGYGVHKFNYKRKQSEFAIRVKTVYPSAPRYNNEGWITIRRFVPEKYFKPKV